MTRATPKQNKALVLEAFDTLFNKRDYDAAERYWSPNYIQHSAHIRPGRDGLFDLIRSAPATLKYEPGVIVAEGDYVIVHGRFSGNGRPRNWIAADIVRIDYDGLVCRLRRGGPGGADQGAGPPRRPPGRRDRHRTEHRPAVDANRAFRRHAAGGLGKTQLFRIALSSIGAADRSCPES